MPISVTIVEDDARVRRALAGIVRTAADCDCVGEYATGEAALAGLPARQPQVVLMDIDLPGMNGIECVRRLAERLPATQILMLTVFNDTDSIFQALAAGATGYLVKPVRAAELLAAIRDAHGGGAPLTSSIARKVVQMFQQGRPWPREMEDLSPREQEVLDLLAQGFLYKEIADRLGVSYATIRTHVERIYQKLRVRSRAQAIARYLGRETA
jgi:DNA-binding NarL/FixJ family response regulator